MVDPSTAQSTLIGNIRHVETQEILSISPAGIVFGPSGVLFASLGDGSGRLIVIDKETHAWLVSNPGIDVDIDVTNATLTVAKGKTVEFTIDAFSRYCLTEGIDQLGFLQEHEDAIRRFEETRSWTP